MADRLNPDSTEMGFLVDQWLVSLRRSGMTAKELTEMARSLGKAARQCWKSTSNDEQEATASFSTWLRESAPRTGGFADPKYRRI